MTKTQELAINRSAYRVKSPRSDSAGNRPSYADSHKRRSTGGVGKGEGVYFLAHMEASFVDYTEFPAVQYYLDKYGLFPSIITLNCLYDYKDFIARVESIKKVFSCSIFAGVYSYKRKVSEDLIRFMFFEPTKYKIALYVDVTVESNGICRFCIHALYNPNLKPEPTIKLIKEKIIGLEEAKLPEEKTIGYINILIQGQSGYELEGYELNPPVIDFSINYNEDFTPIHGLIHERLNTKDSKGLVLLYGPPGNGKTTYLKWLINNVKKKIIFIPPNMVNVLSDPGFVKFLLAQKNSILVVEDAENILMQRDGSQTNQSVSNILNLTDGILSDCANIQVVATFNTNISKIDKALLRKGRLIAKYEFKELTKDRADAMAKKLGVDIGAMSEHYTLANIYNAQEESFEKQGKETIGFKRT